VLQNQEPYNDEECAAADKQCREGARDVTAAPGDEWQRRR
jgi:hypothetical protein